MAYAPIIPALVENGWLDDAGATQLSAANLLGFLLGSSGSGALRRFFRLQLLIRTAMLTATVSFAACSWPLSFTWLFLWRTVAGICGGVVVVLAPPAVFEQVPTSKRGLASGIVFSGPGVGIIVSSTLLASMVQWSLTVSWWSLAAIAGVLTFSSWHFWNFELSGQQSDAGRLIESCRRALPSSWKLTTVYCLNGVGLLPFLVFFVDFVVRGLGRDMVEGSLYWTFFGIGALLGPSGAGWLADRLGFRKTLLLALILQAVAVVTPTLTQNASSLSICALIMGIFTPGIVL